MTRPEIEPALAFQLALDRAQNLEPWEARLRAETAFIRARNAFHGKPARWREPDTQPDEMPPIFIVVIGESAL